ncbi:hypothetical protein [Sphingomonas sp. G-3-2-10]|uniref:hypothetical protein n=1 Tax=Sphingomonas sp. G-3-2-10 TaxID=2728838 RepID=UPI00146B7A00|nr:hypothetical protein [Sphingomonas sp. G-3-2-10]NML06567.1 hypothetical protein [Sphingomonas sp. G-3-2-10]
MIGKAIAGWIGHAIDKRDGEGGTLGALTGVAVYETGKRVLPAAILIGGGVLLARYLRNRFAGDAPALEAAE